MKFFVKSLLLLVATLILVPASFVTATPPSAPLVVPEFNPKRHVLGHLGLFAVLNLTQIALNGMPAQAGHSATQQPATKGPKKKLTFKQHVAHAATTSKAFAKALANWKNYQAYGSELKAVVWPAATKSLKKRTPAQWTKEVLERMKTFATTHKLLCFGVATQLVLGSAYAWHCNNAHTKGAAQAQRLADQEKAKADRDAGITALQTRAQNVRLTAHDNESVVDFTRRIQEAETKKTNLVIKAKHKRWLSAVKINIVKASKLIKKGNQGKVRSTMRVVKTKTVQIQEALRIKRQAEAEALHLKEHEDKLRLFAVNRSKQEADREREDKRKRAQLLTATAPEGQEYPLVAYSQPAQAPLDVAEVTSRYKAAYVTPLRNLFGLSKKQPAPAAASTTAEHVSAPAPTGRSFFSWPWGSK